jgi:2-dehydropantoate 2-reductase
MRIAVMGSGGLGGYFGALLTSGGAEVSFVARGAHLEPMRKSGLRIDSRPEPFALEHVVATNDPGEIGPVDLVMVCVKLWDTEQALDAARPLVGPDTALMSFQNGVLKDSYLRAAFDDDHLIGGVAYVATTVAEPGVITRTGPLQRLVFGEFDGHRSARVEAFHAACLGGGINAEVSDNIRLAIWEKFVFLVGLSATTSTIRVPNRADPRAPTDYERSCSTSCAKWSRSAGRTACRCRRTTRSSASRSRMASHPI